MAVLRPLKLVLTNYPEDQVELMTVPNHPQQPEAGTRQVPFSREVFIERDDFLEDPPKKFFRLAPGREVRLRSGYLVTCTDVVKDAAGEVIELRGVYDPASRGGDAPDGRKVKATLHWVSVRHAVPATVRLYDRLFSDPDPDGAAERAQVDVTALLNPQSLTVLEGCRVEAAVAASAGGTRFQFERQGYFCADLSSTPDAPVFNRTVSLKDAWARLTSRDDS
jgi:glutaminyl-tRNA synthetase